MKTVLITGGSSGIGFEMSKCFAKAAYQILWVALSEKELQSARTDLLKIYPEVVIKTLALDLSKTDSAEKVYHWVRYNNWRIDVLINNAGFATFGFANELLLEREIDMIQLNVLSVFKLTRLFLKDMLMENAGTIINISSNTSFQPVPKMAAYAATKSFVKQYSQSLMEELKVLDSNVRVMTVCPAAIKNTAFKQEAGMENIRTFKGLAATTKEEVARDIWRGFTKGKNFVATGVKLRFLLWLQPLLPASLVQFLLRIEMSEKK
ncbi:MAG: SDR family NAD(P)-dependent oxidoreductase [Bacteroidota bacterium]